VVLVTHNIEEALMLADRLVILGTNPGRIRGEIKVAMPRPRERGSKDFRALADHVYTVMTNPETKVGPATTSAGVLDTTPLPHARPGAISGLLELVEEYGGPEDVAVISDKLRIEVDDLLPILDAAVQLEFAKVEHGDVTLTEIGKRFADAEVEEARVLFRTQALEKAPLVVCMLETLKNSKAGVMKKDFFIDILDENYSEEEAEAQFDTAVTWGRYAGLFDYDSDDETLRLPEEMPGTPK
jgi:NitT/TauT family transport system ATP-binding protein